jgi:hypothetical protein
MKYDPETDTRHQGTRAMLRLIGPLVLLTGVIFAAVGLVSFFGAMGSMGPPRHFWCLFVGFPLIAVGFALCRFAFLGAVTRYVANEVAPVGKDTFNYLADGTKDGVRSLAGAVGEGLGLREPSDAEAERTCPKCAEANDFDARFCNACGAALPASKPCPHCGEVNDPDARFCDNCGRQLA